MKNLILSIMALMAFALSACSQNKNKEEKAMNNNEPKKALVAYFSATGNTKEAAELLAKAADADLYEIQPEQPYTDADHDWHDKQSRSSVEMKNPKSRPAIKGKVQNIAQYETVYIGFPIWWYTAPTIINTFVERTDLKGKTIVVFATSGGSTTSKATKDLKAAYPELTWKEGGLLNSRSEEEAREMVKKVK